MDTQASDQIAEEQAALRRVAMLAARGAPPEEVFAAVTAEVKRLMDVNIAAVGRYDPDGAMTIVARWRAPGDRLGRHRTPMGGRNPATLVFETGRPARMDDFSQASGPGGDVVRRLGISSGVGVPITVEGRLWGVMLVSSTSEEPLPADTEARLAGFTELVGTAIANAETQAALTASRARIVAAFGRGSGLTGLKDRVEALGGQITLHSPPGAGTTLEVHIPAGQRP
jgi:GAF domain-containing protein